MSNEDKLISLKECSRVVGVGRTTFYQMRLRADFPVAVNVTATRQRYWRSEVMAWLERQRAPGK